VKFLQFDQAKSNLEAAGFKVVEGPSAEDSSQAEGVVLDQNPAGGVSADKGAIVTLTVNRINGVPVPNVVGKPESVATPLLKNNGFIPDPEYVADDTVPKGQVISQKLKPGLPVTIQVSSGKEAVEVPDVTGQSVATASNTLGQRGFQVDQKSESNDSVPSGRVIRTEPKAGDKVEPGSTVVLVVSSGPKPTTTTSTSTTSTTTTTKPTTTTSSSSTTTSSTP
jgi:serine/threonine-protein kinase